MIDKKVVLLFLIIIILIFSCQSCIGTKKIKIDDKTIITNKAQKTKDVSKKGKIEVYNNNEVYYVINWTSKSKKSLKVVGNLKKEIKKLKNKIIIAQGKIIYLSQWSGTINITSYKIIDEINNK